jgi:hypothetical protein
MLLEFVRQQQQHHQQQQQQQTLEQQEQKLVLTVKQRLGLLTPCPPYTEVNQSQRRNRVRISTH